ncbi:GSCFA domain-containing protein [Methylocucumis oryzae]|uniref:GSCFA domain-containing protein n=1 Tax=Methylocucumis oryzae TaxID=1632867 RepID=UPI000697709B|nr:GSCFA domain-containing protein [Methylocucumis oryzae]
MKIVFVGHSHIICIRKAYELVENELPYQAKFIYLREPCFLKDVSVKAKFSFSASDLESIRNAMLAESDEDTIIALCPTGNEHAIVSLSAEISAADVILKRLSNMLKNDCSKWISALAEFAPGRVLVFPPPPPIASESFLLANPGRFADRFAQFGVTSASVRFQAWAYQKQFICVEAEKAGAEFIGLPDEVFDEEGFLAQCYYGSDPTHGSETYGKVMLEYVAKCVLSGKTSLSRQDSVEKKHPYSDLPDYAFWKQAVAQVSIDLLEPVQEVPFKISRTDKVATAGSCFAQHISKRLRKNGFCFLVTEASNDKDESLESYDFSALYGNVYTARQLLQLFDRAFGYFTPIDSFWLLNESRYCDPFRPRLKPNGYATIEALTEERERHFQAVREMFSTLDVFVFTLGLTECWRSKLDGAVYPIAPGVAGGCFAADKYEFVNFTVDEVVNDLKQFVAKLRLINPKAKLILTVSPVPLVATYEKQHVLLSTTYSKSVLRVAAEMVATEFGGVSYFPSYEIITGSYNRGRYFAADLRTVTEEGVDHVMSVFMKNITEGHLAEQNLGDYDEEMLALSEIACDEIALEKNRS